MTGSQADKLTTDDVISGHVEIGQNTYSMMKDISQRLHLVFSICG